MTSQEILFGRRALRTGSSIYSPQAKKRNRF